MLVLSRKRNEVIVIGHEIRVAVVDVRGDKVRLGVEAPKEVPVHREEVERAIEREAGGNGAEKLDWEVASTEIEITDQPPVARRRPRHNQIIADLIQQRDELLAENDRLKDMVERMERAGT